MQRRKASLLFSSLACAGLLLACAAPNPYRPLDNGLGYSEVNVARDRFEIMYHGSADQDELTAKKYAILRAAEIAKRENFPYFRIEKSKTREKSEHQTVRESVTRAEPDPYYPYPKRYWGRRTARRTVTYTERRPVVKIVVALDSAACEECLSTEAKISEAVEAGVLGR